LLEQGVVVISVSFTMPPLLLRMEYISLGIVCHNTFVGGSSGIKVFEYVFRIEELRVNGLRGTKFATNNEYLCRDIPGEPQSLNTDTKDGIIPGGRRFCCLYFVEQLVENPDEVIIVLTTKDLRDKGPPFNKEFHCKLQAHKNELRLSVCVLYPCGPDVWCTIVEYHVSFPIL
jgi:hypothetical protein